MWELASIAASALARVAKGADALRLLLSLPVGETNICREKFELVSNLSSDSVGCLFHKFQSSLAISIYLRGVGRAECPIIFMHIQTENCGYGLLAFQNQQEMSLQ